MILKRYYDDNLAQASYLVACEKTKNAVIVDPTVDLEVYKRALLSPELKLTHVLETHVHADFLSGASTLAAETGAELCLSAEGDPRWGYDFGAIPSARKLRDGDEISLGTVSLRVIHTPGHTPEHLTFLAFDSTRGNDPVGALTGDFIFVGDVGRPDLLEKAAGAEGTMHDAARTLYASIRDFVASQPDYLQIWPGHGAGSACGKSLGAMPSSTLGYEKLFNWALAAKSEREFVEIVLKDQTPPPRYFADMKKRNRIGEIAQRASLPPRLPGDSVSSAFAAGATIIDTNTAKAFAVAHIPGTVNIPFNKSFLNWAGALVDPARDLILITGGEASASLVAKELSKIGMTRLRGWFGPDVYDTWQASGSPLETVSQISVGDLHALSTAQRPIIIDVRAPYEWSEGRIPGAIHIPLAQLPEKADKLAADGVAVAVHCKGGGRSSIAASILRAKGIAVSNVTEGFDGWAAAGFPVARDEVPTS